MTDNPVVRWLLAAGAFIVGLATVLGTLAAFGVRASDLADVMWPAGVVILLSLALVVVSAAWYVEQRQHGVSPEDQRLLDRILELMPRSWVRQLGLQDFGVSWHDDLTYPPTAFWHDFADVEHRFTDSKLEAARAALHDAAGEFIEAEAMNAFGHERREDRRNVGWTSGEVEGMPDEYRIFEKRRRTILGAARTLIAAHDQLVEIAKRRGFDVSALTGREEQREG